MASAADPACCDAGVYEAWRRNVPFTYDWLCSTFLEWGSLSADFLGVRPLSMAASLRLKAGGDPAKLAATSALVGKAGVAEADLVAKGAYMRGFVFATRTDAAFDASRGEWEGIPCWLTVADAVVQRPNTSQPHSLKRIAHATGSSRVLPRRRIVHPGEVNRVRALRTCSDVVVTHSDSRLLHVWDVSAEAEARGSSSPAVRGRVHCDAADLELHGHTADAPFALDTSPVAHDVASGGRDRRVLPRHRLGGLTAPAPAADGRMLVQGGVDDVAFKLAGAGAGAVLASVGEDSGVWIWDSRVGAGLAGGRGLVALAAAPPEAGDGQTVAWCPGADDRASEWLLAVGRQDGVVRVWDCRAVQRGAVLTAAPAEAGTAAYADEVDDEDDEDESPWQPPRAQACKPPP
ncbi:hypothetical protein FNF31_03000 [Cafeteria roenbergensis]|uniref:Histone-binding protein RBBP4-like N-terminal domain-containing protein n=1 Tax=Cafeteria roenbergensis TaxID=33653 RepID=A0A5A8DEA1_CAFRO|nr:hypothetical protein FNF31_03000 [Cafeteria roenbergensis]